MSPALRFVRSTRVPWKIVENEAILLDLEEGEVLRLNQVGAEIWSAIDGTRTVGDIERHIERTFDVSLRRARRDVRRFIKRLRRQDFVRELDHEGRQPR